MSPSNIKISELTIFNIALFLIKDTYATPCGASACTYTSKVTLSSSIKPFSGSVTSCETQMTQEHEVEHAT